MSMHRTVPASSRRGLKLEPEKGPLKALQLIESVGDEEPFTIVPITQGWGLVVSADDRMAAKVKWAKRAEYRVLTRNVPPEFAPYNAVIRVSESGTEDTLRDYLADLDAESREDA